jgi:malate dehydrogenase
MARSKVTVVGAGNVGASLALRIAEGEVANVAMVDVVEGVPQGKGLDMFQSSTVVGNDSIVQGDNDWSVAKGSDLVVVTAGMPRKPGMSRDDLLKKNAEIVTACATNIKEQCPGAIVIVVSNPLDVMTYLTHKLLGGAPGRVVGMAGVLDSARYRAFIAMELGVSVKDVQAMVLGGHGDDMVPLPRYSQVSGIPITEMISAERINAINERTQKGGAEIVAHLKTGSAFYAPSAATYAMVKSILLNERRILPACSYVDGQYGLKGAWVGVPAVLGENGVEKIIELKLTDDEKAQLHKSAESVKSNIKALEALI